MRPLAFSLLVLLTAAGALHAQQQRQDDPHLWDNIIAPSQEKSFVIQNKSYYSGGATGIDTEKNANVKTFDIVQKFLIKTFDAKTYSTKDYWGGDFHFATKTAETKTNSAVGKVYDTKAAPIKDAYEAGKDYDVKSYATREADVKGKISQGHLDDVYKGGQMNMDQVRDLLNKNRGVWRPSEGLQGSPTSTTGPTTPN
jgi:hypothetical protein